MGPVHSPSSNCSRLRRCGDPDGVAAAGRVTGARPAASPPPAGRTCGNGACDHSVLPGTTMGLLPGTEAPNGRSTEEGGMWTYRGFWASRRMTGCPGGRIRGSGGNSPGSAPANLPQQQQPFPLLPERTCQRCRVGPPGGADGYSGSGAHGLALRQWKACGGGRTE